MTSCQVNSIGALNSLFGMSKRKAQSRQIIAVCKRTGMIFPHTLLYGIGGTGKTALARAIGGELGYHFVEVEGGVFRHSKDIQVALYKHSEAARRRDLPLLFFIDEIHQLNRSLQEALYNPMKEWKLSTSEGYYFIPQFTLIAATTRLDLLDSNSFLTRFINKWEISRYSIDDIACILAHEFRKVGLSFSSDISKVVASRCLGIPRTAVNLAQKLYITVMAGGGSEITMDHIFQLFSFEGLDSFGLSVVHRKYMNILANSINENGKHVPLGIGAIASKMHQHEDVIKGSIEPVLLEFSFVSPTSRGRLITTEGLRYLRSNCKFQKNFLDI